MSHLHKYNTFVMKLAKYEKNKKNKFAKYNKFSKMHFMQLRDARYGCFLGSIFSLPNVLTMCYLALCRYIQVAVLLKLYGNIFPLFASTFSLSQPTVM